MDALAVFEPGGERSKAPASGAARVERGGLRVWGASAQVAGERLVVWRDAGRVDDEAARALIEREALGEPTLEAIARLSRVTTGGAWLDGAGRLWCWRGGTGQQLWRVYQPRPGCWWLTDQHELFIRHGAVTPAPERLAQFICGAEGGGADDYLRGVSRLIPGEALVLEGSGARRVALGRAADEGAEAQDVLSATRDALERIAGWDEGPLHLSAGLDSATLLALGARRAASMSFPQAPTSDEGPEIEALARAFGVDHLMWTSAPWEEGWEDELFGRSLELGPRAHPGEQYERRFCEAAAARFGASAHLSGHGADQLLWTTRELALEAMFRRGDARGIMQLWGAPALRPALVRAATRALASALLGAEMRRLARALAETLRRREASQEPWWSGRAWVIGMEAAPVEPGLRGWSWEQLQRGLARRQQQSGVTMRSPFLDLELWDAAQRWGAAQRLGPAPGRGPWLWDKLSLRQELWGRRLLPEEIIWRPKHKTFDAVITRALAAPLERLAGELAREPMALARLGVVDQRAFEAALERYRRAPRGAAVWRTYAAELWARALAARG